MQDTNQIARSVFDAARQLGIGRTLMYELLDRGEIKSIKVGTRRLVREAELVRFVATQLAKAA